MIELAELSPFSGMKEIALVLAGFRTRTVHSSVLKPIAAKIPPYSGYGDFQKTRLFQSTLPKSSHQFVLKELVEGYVSALEGDFQKSASFLHPVAKRHSLFLSLHSCDPAERGEMLDSILSMSYLQEKERKACASDRETCEWEGIVIEMAFDRNTQDFVLGRFCRTDPFPAVLFGSSAIGGNMDRVLRELQQHEMDNNASFSVIPESQKDPEYVKEWWGNRKRIDHELSKTLLFLDSHVMEPFSFLFKPWREGAELEGIVSALEERVICDSPEVAPILSLFLHCNDKPLSLSLLHHVFQSMSFPAFSLAASAQSLLDRYNQLLPPSPLPATVVLCLSPDLQNVPFESISFLRGGHVTLSRHLCLQSIRDQSSQRVRSMNSGHFVINIS